MQFGQAKPPIGLIFDSDMGNDVDDVISLAILYGISGKGESRVIGVSVTKPSMKAAAMCDALVRFFSGESGAFQPAAFGGGGSLPIGLALKGKNPADTPLITATLRQVDGKPVYPQTIENMNDTADPVAVIRNALSAQNEKNGVVVLSGPATNLAALLAIPSSKPLIDNKAKQLIVAIGAYPEGPADPAVAADVPAARKLFAEWPGTVIAVGAEVGEALRFPGASIDTAFTWAPAHPLVDAYKAAGKMPYDAPVAAAAGILQAVRPQENYFKLSDPGTITVLDDGRTRFASSAGGKHQYLVVDPAQKERVLQAYVELASAKPVPRAQRFRPPQKKQ